VAVLSDRLFVGVPVVRSVAAEVAAWQEGAGLPGDPVPPANLHLTLRFLGSCTTEQRDRLSYELGRASLGRPFTVTTGPVGAFGKPARASVVWLGLVAGEERMAELYSTVEAAVEEVGFDPEDRPYHPHLTVSRIRPPGDVRPFVDAAEPVKLKIEVDRVVLFKSTLGRGGARYEELESFPLE
jgi:2'-5' RNA ligase